MSSCITLGWVHVNYAQPANVWNRYTASHRCIQFSFYVLATAVGGRPKSALYFLPGRLRWMLLPKERCSNSLNGCGLNTQPSNWEADTQPMSYCCPRFKLWCVSGSHIREIDKLFQQFVPQDDRCMFCFNTSRRTLRYFLFSTNPACPFGVAEYEIIEIAENFASGGQRHGKMVTVQNRPAHNRPLKTDHSEQTTFIQARS